MTGSISSSASTSHSVARESDDEVFLRQNDRSVRLNREQVLALEYDKEQRIFEDELVEDSSLDDIDHEVLDRYKGILGTDAPTSRSSGAAASCATEG